MIVILSCVNEHRESVTRCLLELCFSASHPRKKSHYHKCLTDFDLIAYCSEIMIYLCASDIKIIDEKN